MKYILLSILLIFVGCTSIKAPEQEILSPVSRLFYADYNTVWKAMVLALEKYPIAAENKEKGFIKTAEIKGESLWQLPFQIKTLPRLKYTLHIQFIKGMRKKQAIVQVSVLKQITSQKGFIHNPERIPSTGLEEKNILYRIFREININRSIERYNKLK